MNCMRVANPGFDAGKLLSIILLLNTGLRACVAKNKILRKSVRRMND